MKLLHVFSDTDMRKRHEGLMDYAKEQGVKSPKAGDVLAFLNAKRDRIIVLSFIDEKDCFGVMGYYRSPHGRVPMEAIQYIPQAFGGEGFDMNKAIRAGLVELLSKKARPSGVEI